MMKVSQRLALYISRTAVTGKLQYAFTILILTAFLLPASSARAQHFSEAIALDTLEVRSLAAASSSGNLPWWMHVHRDGVLDQSQSGFALSEIYTTARMPSYLGFTPRVSASLFGRLDDSASLVMNQLYAEIRRSTLTFYGGYRPATRGFTYSSLSTGSLGFSRNARPMPRIGLELDYTPLPFTSGLVEVKGHLGHGWFETNRYTQGPLLHEKSGYLRLGGDMMVNFHAGLVHHALYGGSTPDFGDNPSGFSDFMNIFFGRGDDSVISAEDLALGDHLGIWDFGLRVGKKDVELMLYRHFIFETPQELKFSAIQDGLLGLGLRFNDKKWPVNGILFEHLYTRYQRGPVPAGLLPGQSGQKDYYNHYIYIDGWTHFGRSQGTPLLLTSPDGERAYNRRFASTRVESFHMGIEGQPSTTLSYRLLLTHSTHFGTYRGRRLAYFAEQDYFFDSEPTQFSAMLELNYMLPRWPQFDMMTAFTLDNGEIYADGFGLILGLRYSLLK